MQRFVHLTDRCVLRVAGEGTLKFLQGLCTQNVDLLPSKGALAAAFLSPKGRVLCDTIMVSADGDGGKEVLLDCHRASAKLLHRMLLRHKLRLPLAIEDLSASHSVLAALPAAAAPGSEDGQQALPQGFFVDPRFAALGHRAVLEADAGASLVDTGVAASGAPGPTAYHLWRLCCAVPEGPADLPTNKALPLNGNLDLLNFVSFQKGCYVGQELTHRTKFRGAVRRRFFSVVALPGADPQRALEGMQLQPGDPLPRELAASAGALAARGADPASAEPLEVQAVPAQGGKSREVGTLTSVAGKVGLCMLKADRMLGEPKDFGQLPLQGKRLESDGVPLALRAPPYALAQD